MADGFDNQGFVPEAIRGHGGLFVSGSGTVELHGEGMPGANDQAAWFIDPVNGDDKNKGDTIDKPIKTIQEAVERIGTQIINVAMVWNLMNDFPLDNPFYVPPTMQIGPLGSLSFISIKPMTTLFSGTLTGAVPINAATNTPQQVTDAALPVSWAAVGALNTPTGDAVIIRLTANGARAFGTREGVPFTAGPKTMRTSVFAIPATTLGITPSAYSPVGNEAYVIETGYCKIADFRVMPSGNGAGNSRIFAFGIALPNAATAVTGNAVVGFWSGHTTSGFSEVVFSACDVGRLQPKDLLITISACKVSGFSNNLEDGLVVISGSLVTQNLGLLGMCGAGGVIQADTLFDLGGRLQVLSQGFTLARAGFFDPGVNDAIVVNPGGMLRINNSPATGEPPAVYGSGALRAFINCFGNGCYDTLTVGATTGVGAVTAVRINGRNLGLTYAFVPIIDATNFNIDAGIIGALTGVGGIRYVYPNYTESLVDNMGWLLDENCTLRRLRVQARIGPGGVNEVYTVLLNGAPTALTVTLSGGGTVSAVSDVLPVPPHVAALANQRVSFQINEGASASTDVIIVLECMSTQNSGASFVAG